MMRNQLIVFVKECRMAFLEHLPKISMFLNLLQALSHAHCKHREYIVLIRTITTETRIEYEHHDRI